MLYETVLPFESVVDCKQSLSGQSRWCAHSAARLEREEINEKRLGERRKRKGPFLFLSPFFRLSPSHLPLVRSSFFSGSAISRDLSTIQKGTACSLSLWVKSQYFPLVLCFYLGKTCSLPKDKVLMVTRAFNNETSTYYIVFL